MVSVAGIRGVVGESLLLEDFLDFTRAFLAGAKPRGIVVGGDTRRSGEMIRHLVFAAAIGSGVTVHDLGVVPTPTVALMVRRLRAGGGIAVTASHNPAQWNGLKFFSRDGTFLTQAELDGVVRIRETRSFSSAPAGRLGRVIRVEDPIALHLEAILKALPVASIRRRRFRVVLDPVNGAGLEIAQELFKALGAEMGVIHADRHGRFERGPEPLAANLGRLRKAVVKFKADAGFALDPDADRLAIVDETGRAIGEERTITLAAQAVLQSAPGPVVVNLSTTRAVDDVAARFGVRVERTRIGEAHVVQRMREIGAKIGGEGNGGVIFPRVHMGRDAATGMGLILALMSSGRAKPKRATLSEINAAIPGYAMLKVKIDLPDRARIDPLLKKLTRAIPQLTRELGENKKPSLDTADGLKVSFEDRWLHVRGSGTEPILRLFAEAPTRRGAQLLLDWANKRIG